jgi:hypothetical protein
MNNSQNIAAGSGRIFSLTAATLAIFPTLLLKKSSVTLVIDLRFHVVLKLRL